MAEMKFNWVDNPTVSGIAECNTDVLNDCLMHLKYDKSGSGLDDKIANCLLEVPQNIKLELNNGTLTLKAGSKVIVPNGFEADGTTPKFDYVAIESDKTVITATGSGQYMILYKSASWRNQITLTCFSGDTQPTFTGNFATWYDTANNSVKITGDNGATWLGGWSLPLCLITTTAGVLNSVDQVFNGMGYFGSTVWVDKGVKGLIPNGRNEDGTLNNIEYTNTTLKTITQSGTYNLQFALALTGIGVYYYKHDAINNYIYRTDTGARYYDRFIIGDFSTVDSKITSFQPKQPVRLVTADDIANKVDGQWVSSDLVASTSTSKGVYEIDLSNYLPNDGCNYEVLIKGEGVRSGSGAAKGYVYSSIILKSTRADFRAGAGGVVTSNSFMTVIGADRKMFLAIENNGFEDLDINAVAYRRIGTNQ